MEMSHSDLPKVPRMIPVEIRLMMMLSTRHTATTGMLSVLAHAAVAGGDVTAVFPRLC